MLVNGLRPLYNVTKSSVLVAVLNLPLHFIIIVIINNIVFINFIITRIIEPEQFTVLIR